MTVVLSRRGQLPSMMRLWAVIFAFNVLGTAIFVAAVVYGHVLPSSASDLLIEDVVEKLGYRL